MTEGASGSSPLPAAAASDHRIRRLGLEQAVDELAEAMPFAKARYQTQVFRLAGEMLDSDSGIRALLDLIPVIADAGAFHGGPWERASRLLPRLVGIGLRGDGPTSTIEALSELRMLAIVRGTHREEGLDATSAERFLQEACVQNLDLMYPDASEESRTRPKIFTRAERLFALIREHISTAGFGSTLIDEIETICAQRPIVTHRVQRLLELARQLPQKTLEPDRRDQLEYFLRAAGPVTRASGAAGNPSAYRAALAAMEPAALTAEADAFADSLHGTGISSPYHATLVRFVAEHDPDLLSRALGLTPFGAACLDQNTRLIHDLIATAIRPGTEVGVLGLAKVLDRGLPSRPEIRLGLGRLLHVDIVPAAERRLRALETPDADLEPRALLIAGTVSVLGLPLGIGQGNNPTCQAARALSLWSQHAPGLLLKILVRAVRNGVLHTNFEQHELVIQLAGHEDQDARLDPELDPVSSVLVPLLDRLYAQILQLTHGRGSDPHRWVNPAMYGTWVPSGFHGAFDPYTGAVVGHRAFVRRFFASHHPEFNGGYDLLYPNPVGIILTDVHGNMLGYHAVSVQRVAPDPTGRMRVYFFNPNNEGRQRWGHGVAPTVSGNGEQPGESSLPFDQFASRLYAYHFDPYEKHDEGDVPSERVIEVSRMARDSWGRAVTWLEG